MINTAQKWLILVFLLVISILGAAGLVFDSPNQDACGWVFGAPLGMITAWGLSKFFAENF